MKTNFMRAVRSEAKRLQPLDRPAWLPSAVWPFGTGSLVVDESKIAVTDVGSGPTLLFVHTGMWSFLWRDAFILLSEDFRCVTFDAPGTGRSERIPLQSITLERAAHALEAVIEGLDLNEITLVVHDLGGPSGIAGASRLRERICGLCAVNAFAWRPSGAFFRGMLGLMGSTVLRELDARTMILPRISASTFGVGKQMNLASREAFLAGIGPEGARAFHQYMRSARQSDSLFEEIEDAFGGSFGRLPLLTIFGERNDPLQMQPRWRQKSPGARQVVVKGGNHFPMCDDPNLVADAIRRFHRERILPR